MNRSKMSDGIGLETGIKNEVSISRKFYRFLLRYGTFLTLVLIFTYFSISSPIFLNPNNILNIVKQTAVVAVASFGMCAVVMGGGTHVISGGIDLSIAAIIGFVAALIASALKANFGLIPSLFIGLIAALVIESVSALLVIKLRMIPLLVTLAMMYVVNGLELVVTNNLVIAVRNPFIKYLADGSLFGIPVIVLVTIVMFLLFLFLLHFTPFGHRLQAVGGNPDAAQSSGISVPTMTFISYLLSGYAAAVSGLLVMSRLSGSTPGVANLILLDIVMATYVSSAFSSRWVINIPGALVGAIFVGILTNGFTLINVPTYWVYGVKGVLVLLVVSATSLQQKEKNA